MATGNEPEKARFPGISEKLRQRSMFLIMILPNPLEAKKPRARKANRRALLRFSSCVASLSGSTQAFSRESNARNDCWPHSSGHPRYAYEERKVKTLFSVRPTFSLKGIASCALPHNDLCPLNPVGNRHVKEPRVGTQTCGEPAESISHTRTR